MEKAIHEMHEDKLKSGRSGRKVSSKKQAIAIGLSEAREEGAKVPEKEGAKKAAVKKKPAPKKKAATKKDSTRKKTVPRKQSARKKS